MPNRRERPDQGQRPDRPRETKKGVSPSTNPRPEPPNLPPEPPDPPPAPPSERRDGNTYALVDLADAFTAYSSIPCWLCGMVRFLEDNPGTILAEGEGFLMANLNDLDPAPYITRLVHEWRIKFDSKHKDYDDTHLTLGVKGNFPDINRKFWKLKRAIWDGVPLVGEQPEEILMDLIGHCFITIDAIRKQHALATDSDEGAHPGREPHRG